MSLIKDVWFSAHSITSDVSLAETAKAAEFFLADGLIVTGNATGDPAKPSDFEGFSQTFILSFKSFPIMTMLTYYVYLSNYVKLSRFFLVFQRIFSLFDTLVIILFMVQRFLMVSSYQFSLVLVWLLIMCINIQNHMDLLLDPISKQAEGTYFSRYHFCTHLMNFNSAVDGIKKSILIEWNVSWRKCQHYVKIWSSHFHPLLKYLQHPEADMIFEISNVLMWW